MSALAGQSKCCALARLLDRRVAQPGDADPVRQPTLNGGLHDIKGNKGKRYSHVDFYSLRHTAICMRIILSEGQVNIFNLAKNAGTSVDQIERFYARNLPLSKEMAKNLHSFGTA
jgi:hypothetical protein